MQKISIYLFLLFFVHTAFSQISVDKAFPTADDEITIIYDASKGSSALVGATDVFMHSGVITSGPEGTGWQHVVGNWGNPNSAGKMTSLGNDLWSITITPRTYYGSAGLSESATVYRIGMVFREAGPCGGFGGNSTNCKEGKSDVGGDIFFDLKTEGLQLKVESPATDVLFLDQGESVDLSFVTSDPATLSIEENGNVIAGPLANATSLLLNYIPTLGNTEITIEFLAINSEAEVSKQIKLIIRTNTIEESRPNGIIDGINYQDDHTKATLCLLAPMKESVYVVGDFNNWSIEEKYKLKKDGERFWIEINGLTPGVEYGFQYYVDEEHYIADPFADKILDPEDRYIPESSYPNLKEYPTKALRAQSYYQRVSVLQTNQTPYNWRISNFTPPKKEDLVIYELLIRDFAEDGSQNFQMLIDTLGYFERMGINAIELMPVMEFNGNDSWGYNPTFMFAVDKFYGTKNKLKEFIDAAHEKGIAVIFDIVLNHQDLPGPYVLMYYDFQNNRPSSDNPWFNLNAAHPFNVFFDFNHESEYTKAYVDTVNHYWINEFNIDGYRFDLSKGFTQNRNSDVGKWSDYDQSRIDLLSRMNDKIRSYSEDTYIILEHFGVNSEEKTLSEKGMMLWGNMTHSYQQSTMGYTSGSDISGTHYLNKGWSEPNLVSYMESHDEERQMYKILEFGNSNQYYDVTVLDYALQRSKAAAAFFYTIPGPKMLWQFGEFGYDIPIDENGRTGKKPILWDYLENPKREALLDVVSSLIKLKTTYLIFETEDVTFINPGGFAKQLILKNENYTENPSSADEMNLLVASNFDIDTLELSLEFPHIGIWYDYFSGRSFNINETPFTMKFNPGQFRYFTDFPLDRPDIITDIQSIVEENQISIYPNPAKSVINFKGITHEDFVEIYNLNGKKIYSSKLDLNNTTLDLPLNKGLYLVKILKAKREFKLIITE